MTFTLVTHIERRGLATQKAAVASDSTADDMLLAAVQKHSILSRNFDSSATYVLLYPDYSIVKHLPGTTTTFCLDKYQEIVLKSYSKLKFLIMEQERYLGNQF